MQPVKLVGTNLAALESDFAGSGKSDRIYFDTEIKGFGLRFRSGGNRTWVLQYKVHGADRRLALGPYPGLTAKVARELAHDKLADIWKGNDPAATKRAARAEAQAQVTLRAVIDNYLSGQESKLRPSSLSEARRYLLRDWKGLHGWPLAEIQLPHVAAILDRLEKTGAVAAARSRSYLSTAFRWAMARGYCTHNPVIATANPDPKTQRERVLNNVELRKVWDACADGGDYSTIVRLLILTGQRRTEVGGMAWSELDEDRAVWTIPAGRSKNNREHMLPLPDGFWNIIAGIKRRDGIDNIFGRRGVGFTNWSEPKAALERRCPIPAWTHHDLRRTFRTGLGKLGIPPHIAELCINHSKGGLIAVYDKHRYEGEIAAALAQWCEHLHSILEGTAPTVVPIRKGITPISA
jgi:integrase